MCHYLNVDCGLMTGTKRHYDRGVCERHLNIESTNQHPLTLLKASKIFWCYCFSGVENHYDYDLFVNE